MDSKTIFGILSVATALVQYVPYIRDIYTGRTKPHAFSWFVWGLPAGIVFAAQIVKGAGKGSWATGVTTILCTTIFVLSLFRGEKNITRVDWFVFVLALLAILIWLITNDPLLSVILVSLADMLGCIPTLRKSWYKPYEETLSTYSISLVKWVFSLFALDTISLVNTLYALMMFVSHALIVGLLLWRRKILISKV